MLFFRHSKGTPVDLSGQRRKLCSFILLSLTITIIAFSANRSEVDLRVDIFFRKVARGEFPFRKSTYSRQSLVSRFLSKADDLFLFFFQDSSPQNNNHNVASFGSGDFLFFDDLEAITEYQILVLSEPLVRLGVPDVPGICRWVSSDDPVVRAIAVCALQEITGIPASFRFFDQDESGLKMQNSIHSWLAWYSVANPRCVNHLPKK